MSKKYEFRIMLANIFYTLYNNKSSLWLRYSIDFYSDRLKNIELTKRDFFTLIYIKKKL